MTQCEKILQYMRENGSITPLDALRECGCMRLAARISDLEQQGYVITHKPEVITNRSGEKIHFMSYSLA